VTNDRGLGLVPDRGAVEAEAWRQFWHASWRSAGRSDSTPVKNDASSTERAKTPIVSRLSASGFKLERPWTKTGIEICQGTPSDLYEELKSIDTQKGHSGSMMFDPNSLEMLREDLCSK
jgi:hypothetical protein